MNFVYSDLAALSTISSSRGVPSVTVVSDCVSPRVNKADPWGEGRISVSMLMREHLPILPSNLMRSFKIMFLPHDIADRDDNFRLFLDISIQLFTFNNIIFGF